jgi:hypothetical protein
MEVSDELQASDALRTHSTHWTGGGGALQCQFEHGDEEKNFCPCQKSNAGHPASCFTD